MAVKESEFKYEIKNSINAIYNKFSWCPADKIQSGISDIHALIDMFYAIETKYCKTLPKRKHSKLLKHPFTQKQINFLMKINRTGIGFGCGLIRLSNNSALVVHPAQLDKDGNLTLMDAEILFKEKKQGITKSKIWDIPRLQEIAKEILSSVQRDTVKQYG